MTDEDRDMANAALLLDKKIEERILGALLANPDILGSIITNQTVMQRIVQDWAFQNTIKTISESYARDMLSKIGQRLQPTYSSGNTGVYINPPTYW